MWSGVVAGWRSALSSSQDILRTRSYLSMSQRLTFTRPAVASVVPGWPRGQSVPDRKRILKRLVAGQRLADGLAGVRVPGFAGSAL
jgi:hypothetical protein